MKRKFFNRSFFLEGKKSDNSVFKKGCLVHFERRNLPLFSPDVNVLLLFFFLFFFSFLFNIVYMIEREACQCGASDQAGEVLVWRKVDVTNISIFFSCVQRGGGRGSCSLLSNYISTWDRGQSFDDPLEILMKRFLRVLPEWF